MEGAEVAPLLPVRTVENWIAETVLFSAGR